MTRLNTQPHGLSVEDAKQLALSVVGRQKNRQSVAAAALKRHTNPI
ncbi:hypothetical protein [Rosenbergiella nectarea]|nr:hypothetical protein [Rosenbergiella nectarea]